MISPQCGSFERARRARHESGVQVRECMCVRVRAVCVPEQSMASPAPPCTCMLVRVDDDMSIYTHACTHACAHVHSFTCPTNMSIYTQVRICRCPYVRLPMYISIHMSIQTRARAHARTYTRACTHTHQSEPVKACAAGLVLVLGGLACLSFRERACAGKSTSTSLHARPGWCWYSASQ